MARRASAQHIPVTALVGDVGMRAEQIYRMGVTAVFSTNQMAIPFSEARLRCERDLGETVESILRYQQALGK